MARVIVVGSINQDITVTVDRFPSPGETLSGSSLTYGLGGKGANQAAAAAHSGAETLFVGAVGTDLSGQRLRADLAAHGVDVTHVRDVDGPTGTALITVAASGENTIILDAGANRAVTIEPAKASLFPAPSDIVVLQAEVPSHTNTEVLAWAHSFGARVGWELALTHPEAVASLTLGGLPLHDHLITLRAMLEAHEGTSVTADSETPAADSTDEAIASFTSIIDNSPIQPDALLKFVRIPFGPFFDVPALRAGSPNLPAGHPGAHPHAPIAVVLGDADTIAADGAELYDMVRGNNPLNRFISLPGRDHVNALTSGAFRRGALAFAAEVEAAE